MAQSDEPAMAEKHEEGSEVTGTLARKRQERKEEIYERERATSDLFLTQDLFLFCLLSSVDPEKSTCDTQENRREKQRQLDWLFREVEVPWVPCSNGSSYDLTRADEGVEPLKNSGRLGTVMNVSGQCWGF